MEAGSNLKFGENTALVHVTNIPFSGRKFNIKVTDVQ